MNKYSLLLLSLLLSLIAQSQDYKIDFSASGANTTLDSVHVINLTQTLNGADTLHLYNNTGIGEEHEEKDEPSMIA